jgi:glycosyltransferase involved in cell wall biosynthesis
MKPSCVAVLPVYNEEACIERVCREWAAEMRTIGGMVLAVNDGSRDGSGAILERLAEEVEWVEVLHQENGGHGKAVVQGYRRALGMGAGWVFQVDSDGELPAEMFAEMWRGRESAAFLTARRANRPGRTRAMLSEVHRWTLGAMFGVWLEDPNVPYRLMRADVLGALLDRVDGGVFAPNVFLTLLAAGAGVWGRGPELVMAPRAGGVVSIRGWKTVKVGWRCLREMVGFRAKVWPEFRGLS